MTRQVSAEIPAIVESHPARVLFLVADGKTPTGKVHGYVTAWCRRMNAHQHICSEQITLKAPQHEIGDLPFAVLSLLVGDLPTNLWWASLTPPALAGSLFRDLAEPVQQVIYDSIGWINPVTDISATAGWLAQFDRSRDQGPWRAASDLNWRRLKYWRRLFAQALDPSINPGGIETIHEVQIDHGPHAVVQAWELASWFVSRLGWRLQQGKVQPGAEITWQLAGPQGQVTLTIRRLADGPSEIRRVRVGCQIHGKPGGLVVAPECERRLAVTLEGLDVAPRTITVQPLARPELIARQLSDREHDPVFYESMMTARVLADGLVKS